VLRAVADRRAAVVLRRPHVVVCRDRRVLLHRAAAAACRRNPVNRVLEIIHQMCIHISCISFSSHSQRQAVQHGRRTNQVLQIAARARLVHGARERHAARPRVEKAFAEPIEIAVGDVPEIANHRRTASNQV
jgi:hypothetical protein